MFRHESSQESSRIKFSGARRLGRIVTMGGVVTPALDEAGQIRRVYEREAGNYDRNVKLPERLLFAGGREWVCARAEGEVLEIAVGTGLNLPHYPDGVRLTGIEFVPAMLDIARRRAGELGRPVELRLGDAQALEFEDATFDTVRPLSFSPSSRRTPSSGPRPLLPLSSELRSGTNSRATLVPTMRPQRRLPIARLVPASKHPGAAALVTEQAPGPALGSLPSWTICGGTGLRATGARRPNDEAGARPAKPARGPHLAGRASTSAAPIPRRDGSRSPDRSWRSPKTGRLQTSQVADVGLSHRNGAQVRRDSRHCRLPARAIARLRRRTRVRDCSEAAASPRVAHPRSRRRRSGTLGLVDK
jgi:methyltransferase family protein